SWASDASAIASCPSLRAPEGLKAPVTIDDILEALCALDGGPRQPPGGKPMRIRSAERRAAAWSRHTRKGLRRQSDGKSCSKRTWPVSVPTATTSTVIEDCSERNCPTSSA